METEMTVIHMKKNEVVIIKGEHGMISVTYVSDTVAEFIIGLGNAPVIVAYTAEEGIRKL